MFSFTRFSLVMLVLTPLAHAFLPVQQFGVHARNCLSALKAQMDDVQKTSMLHTRRSILAKTSAAALSVAVSTNAANAVFAGPKEPDAFWDDLVNSGKLSKRAYAVLHNSDTERPNTSELLNEKRAGTYCCAACNTKLFESQTKFNTGTGWPSFYDKLPGVELETGNYVDNVVLQRTEVHCVKCGGHLGHVFNDGVIWQVPTGKRYCINGVSLSFAPA